MKHLGDITLIDWHKVEPVDVVTGGSPCQDLSVAGKRAGFAGKRSGLYMEQIRCVKELREADVRRGRTGQFIRPRYMVWENVAGAFSSGNPKGADFAAVIEELIKIAEPDAVVCVVPPNGGWRKSGCYYDSNGRWSIAWRVHDAQFWGVPQRRKRIALVADFGGLSAPEILFERKGLRGDFAESGAQREGAPCDAEGSVGADDREGVSDVIPINTMIATRHKQLGRGTGFGIAEVGEPQFTISAGHEHAVAYTLKIRSGCAVDANGKAAGKGALIRKDKAATLAVTQDQYLFQPVGVIASSAVNAETTDGSISPCLMARAGTGGNQLPLVAVKTYDARGNGDGETVSTITGAHESSISDYTSVVVEPVAYGISSYESNSMKSANPNSGIYVAEPYRTLDLNGGNPACNQGGIAIVGPTYCIEGNGQRESHRGDGYAESDTMYTLNTIERHAVAYAEECPAYSMKSIARNGVALTEQANPICASDYKDPDIVAQPIAIYRAFFNQGQNALYEPQYYTDGTVPTLVAKGPSAVAVHYIVRRLTPLECERLQGFPDGWTDIGEWIDSKGKKHKDADSPRYKALGNSIALPFWKWMLKRISAQYERDATLGSLFDGIGGFPLCWEQINGKGTTRWASEIEEFPMAVTKIRFGEE